MERPIDSAVIGEEGQVRQPVAVTGRNLNGFVVGVTWAG